jgi:hypothetical protein
LASKCPLRIVNFRLNNNKCLNQTKMN